MAKGSVENSNGRIRRFLPLGTDLALLSDEELGAVTERMSHTPRKCLNCCSPLEVFAAQAEATGSGGGILLPGSGASPRTRQGRWR